MRRYNTTFLGCLLLGSFFLEGCAPVALFGGVAAVGMSATQERGLSGVIDDTAIKTSIVASWWDFDPVINKSVEISVHEGRVLLTGAVDTPQRQIHAISLVWKTDGVREVIDEIQVSDGAGIRGYAGDTWITTKLKAELLFEPEIRSNNYNIKTYDGKVYLIGIAQNEQEVARVLEIASHLNRVKEVVNYVRLQGEQDIMLANGDEKVIPLKEQPTQTAAVDTSASTPTPQVH